MTKEIDIQELLKNVANGSLSVSEAERELRQRIHGTYPETSGDSCSPTPTKLRIMLDSGEDSINAHIPISLLKFGLELTKLLPGPLVDALKSRGVDLTQLTRMQGEDLEEAIASLSIDLKSSDGSNVRVFSE